MVSKGDFLDYVEDAAKNQQLVQDLLTEAYKPNETAQDILTFFKTQGYYGVNLDDCFKLLNVAKAGPLPCDFAGGVAY